MVLCVAAVRLLEFGLWSECGGGRLDSPMDVELDAGTDEAVGQATLVPVPMLPAEALPSMAVSRFLSR